MRVIRAEELPPNISFALNSDVLERVRKIISDIARRGDEALREYTRLYDQIELTDLKVRPEEFKEALTQISPELKKSIQLALENLYLFSEKQAEIFKKLNDLKVEVRPGVRASLKVIPLARVGIYVPGGRYPLFSSLLMAGVPARVAGVKDIVVCSPPGKNGLINPAILYTASLLNVEEIYKIGGAQAVAALAFGTQSIKRVDKIIGPGNEYVAAAKKELYGIVGLDFIAGPTEFLIIADRSASPVLIAADLIAQAEHDPQARPWLITDDQILAERVLAEIKEQLKELKTARIAGESLARNGFIILVDCLEEAAKIANQLAPEHLALMIENPDSILGRLQNYGSLFVGKFTAEALGDYSSGLNHILPTNGASRYTGGLSVKDFFKLATVLEVSREGLKEIGPSAILLAEAEGLMAHAASIHCRLKMI